MRFAICNETYGDRPFERVFQHIAACGYDGVEVAPYTMAADPLRITETQAEAVGKLAENEGLEVAGLHWLLVRPEGGELHLTAPDNAVRNHTAEYAQHLARLCAAMGGRVMVWGSPRQRSMGEGERYEEGFQRAADVLRRVCETAGPLGVTVALEPLPAKETNFLTTAAETVRLIEAVDHEACRLHLDVKAMSAEPDPIPTIIEANREHTAHVHANDPNLRGPGFGDVDFIPIARALKDTGYTGYVSVEVFDYSPDPETIATQSIEYLRRTFREAGAI